MLKPVRRGGGGCGGCGSAAAAGGAACCFDCINCGCTSDDNDGPIDTVDDDCAVDAGDSALILPANEAAAFTSNGVMCLSLPLDLSANVCVPDRFSGLTICAVADVDALLRYDAGLSMPKCGSRMKPLLVRLRNGIVPV